jgi:hypothetical protein
VLVNPTDEVLSGTLLFRNSSGFPANVEVGGQAASTLPYSIPAQGSTVIFTQGASELTTGSVTVTPDDEKASPSGTAIFSYRSAGVTVTQAGVPAVPEGTAFRTYAEFVRGSIGTGLAIANSSPFPATVLLELAGLDGAPTGLSGTVTVPASGQTSFFLDQLAFFSSLPSPFRGVLRLTSAQGVSITALRGRYNARGDFLVSSIPPVSETEAAGFSSLLFPHVADAGGYTTQFILLAAKPGQETSGSLRFYDPSGGPMDIFLLP